MKPEGINTHINTPKHCWDCYKLKDCEQAQNMMADTEPVTGYLVWTGEEGDKVGSYCCENCLNDSDTDTSPLCDESTDSPMHCEGCGAPIDHCLTSDGVDYVKESIVEGAGCCKELWPVIWADYLD